MKSKGKFYFYDMLTLFRPLFSKMMKEYSVVRTLSLSMKMMLIVWMGMIGELMKALLTSTLLTFMDRSGKSGNGGNDRRVDKDFAKINLLTFVEGSEKPVSRFPPTIFSTFQG